MDLFNFIIHHFLPQKIFYDKFQINPFSCAIFLPYSSWLKPVLKLLISSFFLLHEDTFYLTNLATLIKFLFALIQFWMFSLYLMKISNHNLIVANPTITISMFSTIFYWSFLTFCQHLARKCFIKRTLLFLHISVALFRCICKNWL